MCLYTRMFILYVFCIYLVPFVKFSRLHMACTRNTGKSLLHWYPYETIIFAGQYFQHQYKLNRIQEEYTGMVFIVLPFIREGGLAYVDSSSHRVSWLHCHIYTVANPPPWLTLALILSLYECNLYITEYSTHILVHKLTLRVS